jgi:uncharacterized protein YlxW (UPF0749 family)
VSETIHETWLRSLTSRQADEISAALAWAEDADSSADADAERIAVLEAEVTELQAKVATLQTEVASLCEALETQAQVARAWMAVHDDD